MLLCCYYDDNNNQHFEQTTDISEFNQKYPGVIPTYIFDMNTELQMSDNIQKTEFEKYASMFGFTQNDYKAHLSTRGVHPEECEFIGFLPQNRKYKCRVISVQNGHKYKMTPDYVRECIARYQNEQSVKF